ncbi:MAG: sensor histidine kinase [Spirochaetota bacterium]
MQDKYHSLFKLIPLGVVYHDADGKIIDANPAAERILGLSRDQLLGRTAKDPYWKAIDEDGRPFTGAQHPAELVLQSGKAVHNVIMGVFAAEKPEDGTWIRIDAEPLFSEDDPRLSQVVVTFKDITESRRAERELQKKHLALRERVKELNCLYSISTLVSTPGITLDQIIQGIVELIPPAFQHPEFTSASIILDSQYYCSSGFVHSKWYLSETVRVHGRDAGELCVYYSGEIQDVNRQPFIEEEQTLIRTITERLGRIIERKTDEEQIRSLLAQKELLLQEVHHRIKNNMNTMMTLLGLQADLIEDPNAAEALQVAMNRFISMSVLYDKLYRSENLREMSVKNYLPSLIDDIMRSFPNCPDIALKVDIADLTLDVNQLSTLGIIANELISNAIKHAFSDASKPELSISLRVQDNGMAVFTVEDNGCGLPPGTGFENSPGFGLQLVATLSDQLGGVASLEQNGGTKTKIAFEP